MLCFLAYLLRIREGSVKSLANNGKVLRHLQIVDMVALFPIGHFDLFGEWRIADGRHASPA